MRTTEKSCRKSGNSYLTFRCLKDNVFHARFPGIARTAGIGISHLGQTPEALKAATPFCTLSMVGLGLISEMVS
jgi:hypothetical protein